MKATTTRPAAKKSTAASARSAAAPKKAAPAKKAATASKASAAPKAAAPARSAAASKAAPARKAAGAKPAAKQATPSSDLNKIMLDTLKDIYYAEKKLLTGLNKMAKAAAHAQLREAFETHRSETENQVKQLEQVFQLLGQRAQGKRCAAMDGLLEEGSEHIEEYGKGPGRDAALIVGAQKIEHYEMAAYGSLRDFARLLGRNDAQEIFQAILDQESATDEKLTGLSQQVNQEALDSEKETAAQEA